MNDQNNIENIVSSPEAIAQPVKPAASAAEKPAEASQAEEKTVPAAETQPEKKTAEPAQKAPAAKPVAKAAPAAKGKAAQAKKKPAPRKMKKRASCKKAGMSMVKKVFGAVWKVIGTPFRLINRKLDVFRKTEASGIFLNVVLGGLLVSALLCVFFLAKPGIDDSRARRLANSGMADKAIAIVNALERREYPETKMEDLRVEVARGLIESGNHEKALDIIESISDGDVKTNLENKYTYARAEALYDAGDYTGAAQVFYQISGFEDADSRYGACRCALAIQAWQAGNETSARNLLLGVSDVVAHVHSAALKVAGSGEAARQILESDIFDAAYLSQMEKTMESLAAARQDMPEGRIAAGWYHTVGLRGDGTVVAAGDNSLGQCDVSGWQNISRVAAGAFHTVGLKQDGTVVATGNNSKGQCDVQGWTDIIAIAAGTADTIGLKADGSIVAAGMHAKKAENWHGATFVAAGSYSLGCICDNGSMLSTHKGAQMDMGMVLYDLSICGPVSVGVLYDGTMVSSFEGAPQWNNIITATACESGILAVDVDGKIRAHFYNAGSNVDMTIPGKATAVESSGTHHVVLAEDGKVYAFGNNDHGQCDVSGWQL